MDEGSSMKVLCNSYNIGLSTMYDLKKQKNEILSFYAKAENPSSMEKRKTLHQSKNDDVDKILIEWIKQKRLQNFPLTRDIIMEQAKKFHVELGLEKNCEYTTGWFYRFKQRNGVRNIKINGEQASADAEAAESYVDDIVEMVQSENLTLEQIFNADETALYFKYIPKSTYTTGSEKSASGVKEAKDRITVLACANAAGTSKLKLAIIGKSRNPRALRGVKVLPAYYRANRRAWMTQEIFNDWLKTQFIPQARSHCQSVGLAADCKIILFVDNCTAHSSAASLTASNIEIKYLPPNCTSLIQPLDQGVLRSLKCKYKVQFLRKLLDSSNEKCIQSFQKEYNIKDAIWMVASAWEEISKETLSNAWRNLIPTAIFFQNDDKNDESTFEGFKVSKEKLLRQELLDYAKNSFNNIDFSENDVNECFDIDKDVPTVNELSDSELIKMVLHPKESEKSSDDDDENSDAQEKMSNEKCIELTKQLIRGMEQKNFVDESHIMAVYKIQDLFMKQKNNFKQLKIDDMFNKKN